ncbi:2-C-methyl-D-erythritol 4-phosphate cytidylyltransferase [Microlunatus soli]|uniref:2-C-methyl-D-erythritol 4-phosphate cytidylyltransferase n=2 Tax=Microlunatus soli TaxID=630515 RepID=A0A1H1S0R1_9ACTN|nr:2-C-methyl-D-erythritol 4-phosphate cytidylyltransferase [Microlunatus soli]
MIDSGCTELVVVAPAGWQDAFEQVVAPLAPIPSASVTVVAGGAERTHSVRNGLATIVRAGSPPPILLITDAARPLVPRAVVDRVLTAVVDGATAVVPAVPVTDTIRAYATDRHDESTMLDRSRLRAVQTPQGFATTALLEAYDRLGDEVVTDDAGVCERAGHQVRIVDGATESFKITFPSDLASAELLLAAKEEAR